MHPDGPRRLDVAGCKPSTAPCNSVVSASSVAVTTSPLVSVPVTLPTLWTNDCPSAVGTLQT